MSIWIKVNNNKRQKISTDGKFNNYSAQNYINKSLNMSHDIGNIINTFLFDEEAAKKEWKNKMNITLSSINKQYHWVPLYYFPNNYNDTHYKMIPCTDCYIHSVITKNTDPLNCITCEIFQIQNGILVGEGLMNINQFKYYESLFHNASKTARILINSDKYMAENVLTIVSGIVCTQLTKNKILYNIVYDPPQLKKIDL